MTVTAKRPTAGSRLKTPICERLGIDYPVFQAALSAPLTSHRTSCATRFAWRAP
jgi:hypothetical protein